VRADVSAASPCVLRGYFRGAAILFSKTKGVQLASIPDQVKTTRLKLHFSSKRSAGREGAYEAARGKFIQFTSAQPRVKFLARFCGADPDGQSTVVFGQTVCDGWSYRSHGYFILIV
jgi:hypothetical protein